MYIYNNDNIYIYIYIYIYTHTHVCIAEVVVVEAGQIKLPISQNRSTTSVPKSAMVASPTAVTTRVRHRFPGEGKARAAAGTRWLCLATYLIQLKATKLIQHMLLYLNLV